MQHPNILSDIDETGAEGAALEASAMQLVVFNVGDQSYGVDIQQVREIRAWAPVTVIPQAPAFVRGVINLRGLIVPIVDLRAILGLGTTVPTNGHVVIIVMVEKRVVGVLVDSVLDIVGINDTDLKPIPTGSTSANEGCLENLLTLGERTIIIVSPERLLQTTIMN
jgi:purine-binding chemotaxis protein CheW